MIASKQVNILETQATEAQLEIQKVENWNIALQQQLDDAKHGLETAESRISELIKEKKEVTKAKTSAHNQTEKALKEQLKSVQADLCCGLRGT